MSHQEPVVLNDFDPDAMGPLELLPFEGTGRAFLAAPAAGRGAKRSSCSNSSTSRRPASRTTTGGWSRRRRKSGPICFGRRSRNGKRTGCSSTRSRRPSKRPEFQRSHPFHRAVRCRSAARRHRTPERRLGSRRQRRRRPRHDASTGGSRPRAGVTARRKRGRALRAGGERPPQTAR